MRIIIVIGTIILFIFEFCYSQTIIPINSIDYKIYPEVNEKPISLSSPFVTPDDTEYVIALTKDSSYAIIPVTLSNERGICPQLIINTQDFPELAEQGLHNESKLAKITHITGRKLEKINQLAKPLSLSYDGFLAADEDIRSVLINDNEQVKKMKLTHPEMAKCLFHVLNLMDEDLKLNRWNMAHHEWEHITGFWYNNEFIKVRAYDTKGGQQSIFEDGITGAFHIQIWREPKQEEMNFLEKHYGHLSPERFNQMQKKLSYFNSGEMQPQYIMRYGFYEGHSSWRVDPVAIAFIFGLLDLEELDRIFEGELDNMLLDHFTNLDH